MSDHLDRLQTVYDDHFAREYDRWQPVVARVADKFLACGATEHGLSRIRYDACAHENFLALSCKRRYFCLSFHTNRMAIWAQRLDTMLLAPVPHREVVLTCPTRLRVCCRYSRRSPREIARVAAHHCRGHPYGYGNARARCRNRRRIADAWLARPGIGTRTSSTPNAGSGLTGCSSRGRRMTRRN